MMPQQARAPDTHTAQEDPPEGSRATIERELDRHVAETRHEKNRADDECDTETSSNRPPSERPPGSGTAEPTRQPGSEGDR